MKNLLTLETLNDPKFLALLLVSSFILFYFRYLGQAAAKATAKNWPKIWKSASSTAHKWLNVPPESITKDSSYFKKLIRFNRVSWALSMIVSHYFTLLIVLVAVLSILMVIFGKPAPSFPFALMLGLGLPAIGSRIFQVECANLALRKKQLERDLAEAILKEAELRDS